MCWLCVSVLVGCCSCCWMWLVLRLLFWRSWVLLVVVKVLLCRWLCCWWWYDFVVVGIWCVVVDGVYLYYVR